MKKAYSYIRMSTPEQLKGDSIRRQQKATNDYIQEMGLELTDIIQDHGVSAFKGKNAEFGALSHFLLLAENGLIDAGSYLIVESLDRLTRQNVFEAIALLNRIIRLDVNVVTLIDRRIYSKESIDRNETDLMIASITMMRAHEESRTKSVRLSAAWEQKRKIARSGAVTKQRFPLWLRFSSDAKCLELIDERAELIREIFGLSRDGWGAYTIAKELNRRGVKTWGRSSMWQESYIKKLLYNRSLLGEYQPHITLSDLATKKRHPDGKPISGYYPIVVDEVLFADAKDAMAKRRTSGAGRKGLNYKNLFTGTLTCGYCDSGIRFMDKGPPPKGGQYLRCSKAVLTRKCQAKAVQYRDVEVLLLNIIREINFNTAVNGYEWEANLNKLKTERIHNRQAVDELSEKIQRVINAIADIPESADLKVKLRSLIDERQTLIDVCKRLDSQIADHSVTSAEDKGELLRRLNDASLDCDERVMLRKKVNSEIRRFIRAIKLTPRETLPYDDGVGLSDEEGRINIEIAIKYRNESWQFFSQADDTDLHSVAHPRHKILIENSKIANIE